MTRRLLARRMMLAIATFAFSFLAFAPAAAANTVFHDQYTDSVTVEISGVCALPFTIHEDVWANETVNFAPDGSLLVAWTARVQDTFSANGKTLVGEPSTSRSTAIFDADGNLVGGSIAGLIEKIRLPDGTFFIAAGRVLVPVPGGLNLAPDHGISGDVSALCAALAA